MINQPTSNIIIARIGRWHGGQLVICWIVLSCVCGGSAFSSHAVDDATLREQLQATTSPDQPFDAPTRSFP